MKYRGFKLKKAMDYQSPVYIPALRRVEANIKDAKAIIDKFVTGTGLVIGNWKAGTSIECLNDKANKEAKKRFKKRK